MTYHIFIGYDEREKEAFQVAKYTLEKNSSVPLKVHKLCHRELRAQGLFKRPWRIEESGQYVCEVDGKPFSTQFSHTRFLVPELWRTLSDSDKSPLVMFVDSDFAFVGDVKDLFDEVEAQKRQHNSSHPVYCVQHHYVPDSDIKMDNMKQVRHSKKLWTSLLVWDMDHSDNEVLTPELINMEDGGKLHQFNWINNELRIGSISESFNFIPNHSEKNTSNVQAIHWTTGGPYFKNYRNCRYADIWWGYYNEYLASKLKKVSFEVEDIIDCS